VAAAREFRPDAVLLDVMLPDVTGREVLRRLRVDAPTLPVMFLTPRDAADDRVAGLAAGGDDCLTKPFSLEDVVARLRRILRRRSRVAQDDGLLVVGDLLLDEESRQVTRGGQDVQLSATEFELLRHLMRNAGRVMSTDELFDWVWQYSSESQLSDVEAFMCYLRRKLGAGRAPMIRTVRGAGYALEPGS
jgi:two-component system OmpR family response regulator